jgi:protein-S-isoprenylcysteine O-methyltransferase Ste14
MPDGHPSGDAPEKQNAKGALRRGILWLAGYILLMAVSIFVPAGRLDWIPGWAFIVTYLVLVIAAIAYLWRTNPDVIVARSTFHPEGQPVAQMVTLVLLFVLFVAMFPIAAIDAGRFHWSRVSPWRMLVGYILLLVGMLDAQAWSDGMTATAPKIKGTCGPQV